MFYSSISLFLFILTGDGPAAKTYSKLHGKENRVYCKPQFFNHDELAAIYASSDCHVSASEFETLGRSRAALSFYFFKKKTFEVIISSQHILIPRKYGSRGIFMRHSCRGS